MVKKSGGFPEGESWFLVITFIVMSLVMGAIVVIHAKNLFYDLFTNERKAVKHRRNAPKKTNVYREINWCTMLSITCFFGTEVAQTFAISTSNNCGATFTSIMFTFAFAKALLFIVFLLRLIQIFGDSQFAYSKMLIYPLLAINVVFGIAIPCSCPFFIEYFTADHDGFPDPCYANVAAPFLVWLIGWDFSMNVICLILFVVPLYRILKAVKRPETDIVDPNTDKASGKMKFVAIKVSVLTMVSTVSTILAVMVGGLTRSGLVILGIDWIINSVCIVWMTPYYPDDKYFGKFCHLCVKCCGGDYQSHASEKHHGLQKSIDGTGTPGGVHGQRSSVGTVSTVNSVDTVDQIKASAKDCTP